MTLKLTGKELAKYIILSVLFLLIIFFNVKACSSVSGYTMDSLVNTTYESRLGTVMVEFKDTYGVYYTENKAVSFNYETTDNFIFLTYTEEEKVDEIARLSDSKIFFLKQNLMLYKIK